MPDRFTFPRRVRLTRKRDFTNVFEHGRKVVGPLFVCYWVRREGQESRLGVAVSRKVGRAVVRNRIKRYIREYYRTHRPGIETDAQIVVIARPPAAGADYAGCSDALDRLLERGGLRIG